MKKVNIILSCVLALTLIACSSKEDKADKLIKQYMYENLYDFGSYEPLKTTVDTLLTDVHFDKEAFSYAVSGKKSLKQSTEYLDEVRDASESMDIWSGSYTSYGQSKWNEANEKMQKNLDKAKQCLAEVYGEMIKIQERNEELIEKHANEMIGWKVEHRFRCKTKGGDATIGNYLFVMDKDLKEIVDAYDVNDDDYEAYIGFIDDALSRDKAEMEAQQKSYLAKD